MTMAAGEPAAAKPAAEAQPIEENASANVAIRDEVWRRLNWLPRPSRPAGLCAH